MYLYIYVLYVYVKMNIYMYVYHTKPYNVECIKIYKYIHLHTYYFCVSKKKSSHHLVNPCNSNLLSYYWIASAWRNPFCDYRYSAEHIDKCANVWIICLPWAPTTFMFRGYNPYFGGLKPPFFMVLGSKGTWMLFFNGRCRQIYHTLSVWDIAA